METLLIIYGISIIPAGVACHYIAKARGANAVEWGVNGIFLGFFAVPMLLLFVQKKAKINN
jgi:hypothetical protein